MDLYQWALPGPFPSSQSELWDLLHPFVKQADVRAVRHP